MIVSEQVINLWKCLPVTRRVAPLLALLCVALPNPAISQQEAIRSVTIPEINKIEAENAKRTDAQKKMSSHLLDAVKERQTGAVVPGAPRLRAEHLEASAAGTLVDIDANVNEALLNAIRQAGGTIVSAHPVDNAIRAYIPLDRLESIARNSSVNSISPAAVGRTNASRFDREGEVAHRADKARELFRIDGSGVRIGILSDSIDDDNNSLEAAYREGAIKKENLHVIPGQAGEGSGEGLAMAEIVYALAPGASIYFATGHGGPAQMAANIRALQQAGCVIIVDDETYFNESPFQDGPIARAVSEVTAKGALYFSSAANSGSKKHNSSGTWEGDFTDGGTAPALAGQLHAFSPGATVNTVLREGSFRRVDLFWADPLGRSSNQYNLYVVDAEGHVLRSDTTDQTGRTDPYKFIETLNVGEGIVITKSAEAAPLFMHLDTGRARLSIGTDGSIRGHNAALARNAFSVAAIEALTPPEPFSNGANSPVEVFSSDGPRRMFFNVDGSPITPGNLSSTGGRVFQKPDITAADGVTTSLPRGGGLNPFHGTSAAAPHAGAIAALILSYDRTLRPEQVRDIMIRTARPIDGGAERNNTAGVGIAMAFEAVREACLRTQPFCPRESDAVATTSDAGAGARQTPTGLVREPGGVLLEPTGVPQTPAGPLRNPTGLLREP